MNAMQVFNVVAVERVPGWAARTLLVTGRTYRTLSWSYLPRYIVGRLLPHYPWQPALLQRQIDAMYQLLELLEGCIPKLLVGEQRTFMRNQLRSPLVF